MFKYLRRFFSARPPQKRGIAYPTLLELLQGSKRVSLSDLSAAFLEDNPLRRFDSIRLSKKLYRTNEFAQGVIDRYVGKIVNIGFTCSPLPVKSILSQISPEIIDAASDKIEAYFRVWSQDPQKVSVRQKWTFGELQRIALRESLICGDVLVVVLKAADGFPLIELIGGDRVQNTQNSPQNTVLGVEIDKKTGQERAYHILDDDATPYIIPAYAVNGRRQAWLLRAQDSTGESVRGVPFLEVILRCLSEINDSLAAEQRAMLINALFVLSHTRAPDQSAQDNDTPHMLLSELGKLSKNSILEPQNQPHTDSNQFTISEPRKGLVVTNLGHGEEIKSHDSKRPNLDVSRFIMECVKTAARAKGIPPEVFLMEYNTSYSASTAAKVDFYELQRLEASRLITWFCLPVYREFLLGVSEFVEMPEYRAAVLSDNWAISGAWENAIWNGLQYRQVDLRATKSLEVARANGWMTSRQISEVYFGTNFYANVRQIAKEKDIFNALSIDVSDGLLFGDENEEISPAAAPQKSQDGENYYNTDTFDGVNTK